MCAPPSPEAIERDVCSWGCVPSPVVVCRIPGSNPHALQALIWAPLSAPSCVGCWELDQRLGMETEVRSDDNSFRPTFLRYSLGLSVAGNSKAQALNTTFCIWTAFCVKMIRQLVNSPFPKEPSSKRRVLPDSRNPLMRPTIKMSLKTSACSPGGGAFSAMLELAN